jgi:hypothetical protein
MSRAYGYVSAGSANQDSQVVRPSKCVLRGLTLFNTTAAARHVRLYDQAAAPTSSSTPALRFLVPAGGGVVLNLSSSAVDPGVGFEAGLGHRITTGAADNDTGAASANEVFVNLLVG